MRPLLVICIKNIFSHSVACLLILFLVSFLLRDVLDFNIGKIINLFLLVNAFYALFQNLCLL